MRTRVIRPNELVPRIKPGSFLAVELVPGQYLYVRKLEGLSRYVYYDLLAPSPQVNLLTIAQQPVLLTVDLLAIPDLTWPILGWLPLAPNWPPAVKMWKEQLLPRTEEAGENQVLASSKAYFLVEEVGKEIRYTPAKREDLRGLLKWTLYPPGLVEEKLRLHYGLTKQGERVAAVPLNQQEPW